jgi:tetratricopeptide (TPR) repeat protein
VNRGTTFIALKRYDAAISDYSFVLSNDGRNADAFNGRCYAELASNELRKALGDCDAVVRLRPQDGNILDTRDSVYLRLRKPKEALSNFSRAIQLDPHLGTAWYGRALSYSALGIKERVASDVQRARELDSGVEQEMALRGLALARHSEHSPRSLDMK